MANTSTDMLECDKGCLYSERSASKLSSAKFTGIARCVKHGHILEWATWAYGMTEYQARAEKKRRKARRSAGEL